MRTINTLAKITKNFKSGREIYQMRLQNPHKTPGFGNKASGKVLAEKCLGILFYFLKSKIPKILNNINFKF